MTKLEILAKALLRNDSRFFYMKNNELIEINEISNWKGKLTNLIEKEVNINDESNDILGISFKSKYLGDNYGLTINEDELEKYDKN